MIIGRHLGSFDAHLGFGCVDLWVCDLLVLFLNRGRACAGVVL
jgi:hypothetical protein